MEEIDGRIAELGLTYDEMYVLTRADDQGIVQISLQYLDELESMEVKGLVHTLEVDTHINWVVCHVAKHVVGLMPALRDLRRVEWALLGIPR